MACSSNHALILDDRSFTRSSGVRALVVAAVAFVFSGITPPDLHAQTLNFRQYTSADGLPQSQVMGMYQDRLGYMWFATYGGLSRFDGSQFRTYTKEDGLSANAAFDIIEDSRGRMLVATSGGLCIRENGGFRCRRQSDGLVSDNARTITLDGTGGVWVGTLVGLSHMANGTIRNYTTADGLPAERVIRVVVDSAKRVWVATPNGLVRRNGERFVPDTIRFPGDTAIQFMSPARGGLLIGVEGHLYLRNGDVVTPIAEGSIPPGTTFIDGTIDRTGTIWVATRAGALRIHDDQVDRIGQTNGLLSDLVIRIMVDREGDVWFGTENGASKHAPGPFRTYTTNDGLPSPFVRDMVTDAQGRMWTGTRNGVAVREGERFRQIPLPGVPDPRVYGLAREPNDGMLIGTRKGLVWYRDGRTRLLRGEGGTPRRGRLLPAAGREGRRLDRDRARLGALGARPHNADRTARDHEAWCDHDGARRAGSPLARPDGRRYRHPRRRLGARHRAEAGGQRSDHLGHTDGHAGHHVGGHEWRRRGTHRRPRRPPFHDARRPRLELHLADPR
jgi:ligand-binding sensor domain-containing protein